MAPPAPPARRWRLERRPAPSPLLTAAVSAGAVLAALVATGVVFAAFGVPPLEAFATLAQRTLLDPRGLSETVRKAVPLLLAGVGVLLALRARFWNIGAEGQILAGAIAASGVALFVPLPGPVAIPALFVAGFLGGAAWGLVPALLKARLGVNEIITTLMMNYVAIYLVRFLITGPWKGSSATGFAYTDRFERAFWLPTIGTTRLHWPTLAVGLALVVLIALLLARSKLGFEIRMLGESPAAARYAGVDALRATLVLALLSAGAAGLAGVGEAAGIHHRLVEPLNLSRGYGYTAIIAALLARGNPLAVIPTALLLGVVDAGGDVMKVSLGLPSQMTGVINGLVLLFLIASEPLLRWRLARAGARLEPAAGPAGSGGAA